MKVEGLVLLIVSLPFMSCGYDHSVENAEDTLHLHPESFRERAGIVDVDAFGQEIVQRTCALYVAVRSGSFKSPASFDRDIDETMVRWNMCDDGTMVACAYVPAANGDTVRVGIPWPYDVAPQF